MPTISVIVPVYKVESYLDRCVQSVLRQSFTDFELILVDDGSPDNCPAMCDEYAKKDPRVVVIHQENGGLSAARNAGIDWAFANSDSEWITFIDSDDWVDLRMLEVLIQGVHQHKTVLGMCDYYRSNEEAQREENGFMHMSKMTAEEVYVHRCKLADVAVAKLYKKQLFIKTRYPLSYLFEDAWVTSRLLFEAMEITVIDKPLYCYYINPNSITQSKWNPNWMVEIAAHEKQLSFFESNQYPQALAKGVVCYFWILEKQLNAMRALQDSATKKYEKIVYRKMRFSLRKYKKILNRQFYKCMWEFSHPKYSTLFGIYRGALRMMGLPVG